MAATERAFAVRHVLSDEDVYRLRIDGRLMDRERQPRMIDLFSGAGGLTLGFTEFFGHSFVPVWANDFDPDAVSTYNKNFGPHCVSGDIVDILSAPGSDIPQADIVVGGPPCQGFSLLNRNRDGDPRRELWRQFLEVTQRCGAQVFVMENVPQILGTPEHQAICSEAEGMGFTVRSAKLCAADYGVPQLRWRAFIVGARTCDPGFAFPPRKTHYDVSGGRVLSIDNSYVATATPRLTVRDAIGDLPPPTGSDVGLAGPPLDLHFGRNPTPLSLKRYEVVSGEGMNRFDLQRLAPELTPSCWIRKTSGGTDLFGRLWWDRPAFTIRTEFFKPEKGRYLHPQQHRPITHREAARLQSFPDSFVFVGSKTAVAKQIGNAVPPLMAARIADVVYAILDLASLASGGTR